MFPWCARITELQHLRPQAARIVQELDTEWDKLAVEHFGGDLECADTQVSCRPRSQTHWHSGDAVEI